MTLPVKQDMPWSRPRTHSMAFGRVERSSRMRRAPRLTRASVVSTPYSVRSRFAQWLPWYFGPYMFAPGQAPSARCRPRIVEIGGALIARCCASRSSGSRGPRSSSERSARARTAGSRFSRSHGSGSAWRRARQATLGPSYRQLGDHERRAPESSRTEDEVGTDTDDRVQQMREVPGDRDPLHGERTRAALEVVARRAERELAGQGIDRVQVQERRDRERRVEPVRERDRVVGAGGDEVVRGADTARRTVAAAPGVARRLDLHLPRGLERGQVTPQNTRLHERARRRGHALAVERHAAQPLRPAGVVDDGHLLVGDALSDLAREQAPALEDVVRREEGRDRAQEVHRHPRVEDDGELLRLERLRPQLLGRALRGAAADARGVELADPSRRLAVVADLPLAVRRRDRRRHRAGVRLAVGRANAGRRRDDRRRDGVARRGLAKMGNPGIGLARGGLDRERDLGELAHRPVLETALEDVEVHIVERPRREAEVCVGLGDAGHALRLLHTGDDALLAQVARMRETEALPIEDADADAALAARDDVLDRAVLDLHGSGARFLEEDLPRADAAGAERIEPALDDGLVGHALAHFSFPPTTTEGMRMVGCASATGAPCPSLPQVPVE